MSFHIKSLWWLIYHQLRYEVLPLALQQPECRVCFGNDLFVMESNTPLVAVTHSDCCHCTIGSLWQLDGCQTYFPVSVCVWERESDYAGRDKSSGNWWKLKNSACLLTQGKWRKQRIIETHTEPTDSEPHRGFYLSTVSLLSVCRQQPALQDTTAVLTIQPQHSLHI